MVTYITKQCVEGTNNVDTLFCFQFNGDNHHSHAYLSFFLAYCVFSGMPSQSVLFYLDASPDSLHIIHGRFCLSTNIHVYTYPNNHSRVYAI